MTNGTDGTTSDDDLLREMEELRRGFIEGLSARVEKLRRALVSLDDSLEIGWSSSVVEQLRADAHKLRGTAGCYGEEALGDAAGSLEDLLLALMRSGLVEDTSDGTRPTRSGKLNELNSAMNVIAMLSAALLESGGSQGDHGGSNDSQGGRAENGPQGDRAENGPQGGQGAT